MFSPYIYLANNLYGYTMCKYMRISDFVWYAGNPEVALDQLQWMSETDDIGRFYEVDILYLNIYTTRTTICCSCLTLAYHTGPPSES